MKIKLRYILPLLLSYFTSLSQNKIDIKATLNVEADLIEVKQSITYFNTSNDTLYDIYLNDWNHSFSSKYTLLAERFAEEFDVKFRYTKKKNRGYTNIISVKNEDEESLKHNRLDKHLDVINVKLTEPILPQQSYTLNLHYNLKIPSDQFTRYGVSSEKEYYLKYWYISPAIYDNKWQYYSNKNLDDYYHPLADINLQFEIPKSYRLITELDKKSTVETDFTKVITANGKSRLDSKLFITKTYNYTSVETDFFTLVSDIYEKNIDTIERALVIDKIAQFTTQYLGDYPHKKLLVTDLEARKDPVYGLNQLPSFIRPYPKNFQFELKLLKTTLNNFLDNTLHINPRREQWLKDALQIYFLMKYVDENYPNMKLAGSLADIWGLKAFHAADAKFNDQYRLVYMHMARTNRDQPLTMAKDSLLKFNSSLANKYKAGVGLKLLDDFINADILEHTIKTFLDTYKLKSTSPKDFETLLKSNTDKDINWFFEDFLTTRTKIDFKIKDVEKFGDSVRLTIKNKRNNKIPISLFSLKNDSIVSKQWIENVKDEKVITVPKSNVDKLVLNLDNGLPEFNLRDNRKSLKKHLFNRPLQFRLFQDLEDERYNQLFFLPQIEFNNIYDGLELGVRLSNRTILRKAWNYRLTPNFGTNSGRIIGGGTVSYRKDFENRDLRAITTGVTASIQSIGPDNLSARRFIPFINFTFRKDDDFRSNKFQVLNFRYVDISRDNDPNNILGNVSPDYRVFNARYVNSNPGLFNFYRWFADFQISDDFGKIAFNYEYRKLLKNDRQINFRFYAGAFLYNDTFRETDFFSFALDRPTDYLFDFNYLGRFESSGLVSQQIIIAEGGFKSQLPTAFANQWITTATVSTSIWKYIHAYGDVGFVKNREQDAEFVYDSGIRLNLVADFFELYFPVYSTLGFEPSLGNYEERIRFLVTVDLGTLLGLFRRKWF